MNNGVGNTPWYSMFAGVALLLGVFLLGFYAGKDYRQGVTNIVPSYAQY